MSLCIACYVKGMYKVIWDTETRGVRLMSYSSDEVLGVAPRPVFWEELDLLKLQDYDFVFPQVQEPLMWACNKQYFYNGELIFEVKGANVYDDPKLVFQADKKRPTELKPVDVNEMLSRCEEFMFLLESEAVDFIRDVYLQYVAANRSTKKVAANQLDYDRLLEQAEKKQKRKMALIKEECDSFDIVPLEIATSENKRVYQTNKIDKFLASFSGGKDSQVVLDLCTRAIPSTDFEVIYSDTGYELPSSLSLYDTVKQHYLQLFPDLKFSTAKNHESVLNYWDKIGTPSNTHRWCCSVMKTAPLYRQLKIEGTNKQAKVLAFEGTRAEESTRRSGYERIGKGVKHNQVINARPILEWNTTEVFLYLFKHNLPINEAYRVGKPRVGCLICPFSSEWDDMIVNKTFPNELKPFLTRIEQLAIDRKIPNKEEYVKGHKWRLRASGKFMKTKTFVSFTSSNSRLSAKVVGAQADFSTWIKTLGDSQYTKTSSGLHGEFKYKQSIYSFEIIYDGSSNSNYTITFNSIGDTTLIGLIKRIIYKAAYCIQCEACEVECPTGALSVYPKVTIDSTKCIHCLKCLTFHNKGCIVADSISMPQTGKEKLTGISGYGTFGLREEWLAAYLMNPNDFWTENYLGKKQVPSLKAWLSHAGISDNKGNITPLGAYLSKLYPSMSHLVWEVIWINLTYSSPLVEWFVKNVRFDTKYSKSLLLNFYEEQYTEGHTTFRYSLDALYNTLNVSPIGSVFGQKTPVSKTEDLRKPHDSISKEGIIYSLYRYAEQHNVKSFRVEDIYNSEDFTGLYSEFGTDKSVFERTLRAVSANSSNILTAELNMGLDHITLNEDYDSLEVLKLITTP